MSWKKLEDMKSTKNKVEIHKFILCSQKNLASKETQLIFQQLSNRMFTHSLKTNFWLSNHSDSTTGWNVFINQLACGQWVTWKENTSRDNKVNMWRLHLNQFKQLFILEMSKVKLFSLQSMLLIAIISRSIQEDKHFHHLQLTQELMRLNCNLDNS